MDELELNDILEELIDAYDLLVQGIDRRAREDEGRAYGGVVRAGKGKLVESITKQLVEVSWNMVGGESERLAFDPGQNVRKKIPIPMKREYIERISDPEVKEFITRNIDNYQYNQKSDVHVYIDGKFVMAVECKSYTENAMLKRILVDFTLLREVCTEQDYVLVQLESQLGGDYSELGEKTYGSYPTHSLLSFFEIDLDIITLLRGERKVKEPIHDPRFYKPLEKATLRKSVDHLGQLLQKYV